MHPWLWGRQNRHERRCVNIGQAQHRLAHLEEGQGGADAEALAQNYVHHKE